MICRPKLSKIEWETILKLIVEDKRWAMNKPTSEQASQGKYEKAT